MSDPVTNADIEDVLSSIRRLVAEDDRPEANASAKPVIADRLVLTPALRVMDVDAPEEVASADVADVVEDEEPIDTDLPAPELVEGHELAELAIDDSAKRNLEARIAELEAVISDTGGQWEQDGEEGSDNAGGAVERLNWDDAAVADTSSAPDDDAEEAQMAEQVEEDLQGADAVAAMPFLRHAFKVPEESETVDSNDEPAPDAASENESMQEAEAAVELDPAVQEPVTEMSDDPDMLEFDQNGDDVAYEGQDFVVDEEALRALVVEIVHQELQGKMGERITRNVRNLVRREIHRALTSQELE